MNLKRFLRTGAFAILNATGSLLALLGYPVASTKIILSTILGYRSANRQAIPPPSEFPAKTHLSILSSLKNDFKNST